MAAKTCKKPAKGKTKPARRIDGEPIPMKGAMPHGPGPMAMKRSGRSRGKGRKHLKLPE